MSKLNRYSFIGNLGSDAEVRQLDGSTRCAISFNVAVTEKWKDARGEQKEATTWVRCTLWREQGKTTIADYLKKGTPVYVEGKPSARAYVAQDGTAKGSLEVQVFDVELLGGKRDGAAPAPQQAQPTFGGAPMPTKMTPMQAISQPAPIDDDLPF